MDLLVKFKVLPKVKNRRKSQTGQTNEKNQTKIRISVIFIFFEYLDPGALKPRPSVSFLSFWYDIQLGNWEFDLQKGGNLK